MEAGTDATDARVRTPAGGDASDRTLKKQCEIRFRFDDLEPLLEAARRAFRVVLTE